MAGKQALTTLMSDRPRRATISPEEQASTERRGKVEQMMWAMFEQRAQDPFAYVMPIEEQKYYDERRDQIYGEQREGQQQQLMGAMSRTGTLASGATNYNLMRFGQQTLRDQQQFYFQDRSQRLREKEGAIQSTMGMGGMILGAPAIGMQQTDLANERAKEHSEWRNRWANIIGESGYA